MTTIHKELIDSVKIQQWLKRGRNVLFESLHGVGKTMSIKSGIEKAGLNWIYLPGSTCDPYLDFVGMPRILNVDGVPQLTFVTKQDLEKVEVIFIDEFNRAPKAVRNGCMEIIQFRTINGKPLPNLKCVWAAINPADDNETYDVEPLDPAQKDRFHIKVKIPYECCPYYFTTKYGEATGLKAIKWWNKLDEKTKLLISPRCLDYAIDEYFSDGDIRDVLDEKCNPSSLISVLSREDVGEKLKQLFTTKDISATKKYLKDNNLLDEQLEIITKRKDYMEYFLDHYSNEVLTGLTSNNYSVMEYVVLNAEKPKYNGLLSAIMDSGDAMDNTIQDPQKWNTAKLLDKIIKENKDFIEKRPIIKEIINGKPNDDFIGKKSFTDVYHNKNKYNISVDLADNSTGSYIATSEVIEDSSVLELLTDEYKEKSKEFSKKILQLYSTNSQFKFASSTAKKVFWTDFIKNFFLDNKEYLKEISDGFYIMALLESMSTCSVSNSKFNAFLEYENFSIVFNSVYQLLSNKDGLYSYRNWEKSLEKYPRLCLQVQNIYSQNKVIWDTLIISKYPPIKEIKANGGVYIK